MFLSEMTQEELQAEFEDFLAWQEEQAAEEAAMTPEQKDYLRQAEARVREEEAIGEMYASLYAFDQEERPARGIDLRSQLRSSRIPPC